jgi:GABA(A) receptor-associated protein
MLLSRGSLVSGAFEFKLIVASSISARQSVSRRAMKFKEEYDLDSRKQEAAKIRQKYPDRVPVICERDNKSHIVEIDKKKYLVPKDLTVGQFMFVIRKRINLEAEKAIFLFINNTLPASASSMGEVDEASRDEDGFLYITYSGENTFGGYS